MALAVSHLPVKHLLNTFQFDLRRYWWTRPIITVNFECPPSDEQAEEWNLKTSVEPMFDFGAEIKRRGL
jgi:hypothetical protein